MASPLLEYANARARIPLQGRTKNADGRYVLTDNTFILLICYLKRAQYTGVSSGSRKIPLPSELYGEMLPGASADEFYYRGYALQYAQVLDDYDWIDSDLSDITLFDVNGSETFTRPQSKIDFSFGNQPVMTGTIQRSTGVFGGKGIDEVIYPVIGVEIQITGAEILV